MPTELEYLDLIVDSYLEGFASACETLDAAEGAIREKFGAKYRSYEPGIELAKWLILGTFLSDDLKEHIMGKAAALLVTEETT